MGISRKRQFYIHTILGDSNPLFDDSSQLVSGLQPQLFTKPTLALHSINIMNYHESSLNIVPVNLYNMNIITIHNHHFLSLNVMKTPPKRGNIVVYDHQEIYDIWALNIITMKTHIISNNALVYVKTTMKTTPNSKLYIYIYIYIYDIITIISSQAPAKTRPPSCSQIWEAHPWSAWSSLKATARRPRAWWTCAGEELD